MIDAEFVKEIKGLAQQATAIQTLTPKAGEVVLIPEGKKLSGVDAFLPHPTRKAAKVTVTDVESFCSYYEAFKEPGSRIFGDLRAKLFTAVIDYHETGDGKARWREHVVTLTPRETVEWSLWKSKSGKGFEQREFAEFIESNLPDIADPPGADVLLVAQSLQAKIDVKFDSSIRLSDGQRQFTYTEDIKGTIGKGTIAVPEKFTLGLTPYDGAGAYRVEALLRYRLNDGTLKFWYELLRPHKVEEDALSAMLSAIHGQTGDMVIRGSAA